MCAFWARASRWLLPLCVAFVLALRGVYLKNSPQKAISHTGFSSKRKVWWSLWAEKLIYHHCGLEMQARWNKVLTRPRTLYTRTSLFAVHWFRKTRKAWERKVRVWKFLSWFTIPIPGSPPKCNNFGGLPGTHCLFAYVTITKKFIIKAI